jgi:signal transduction histidine kinase
VNRLREAVRSPGAQAMMWNESPLRRDTRRERHSPRRSVAYWAGVWRECVVTELERKIYHEQIRLIYNQGPVLVAGATLCAVIITLFLWRHLPQSTLLFWLAAVGLSTLLRIWVIAVYLKADARTRERPIWGPFFWLGTLTAGMIWGAWPLMFYQLYSTEYLLLISTIFAGMVAVSAASGSIYLPSFLSFSIPLILPLGITHIMSGNESLVLTGLLLIMFLAVNFFLAARGHRQYRELIRSQFENEELMERLAEEKRIAERAIIAKSRFLAAASHDLRQPLHAMGLFLGALRHREHEPRKLEIINDMGKSAEALNGLFNSLLDVSRLDAEIIEFNPTHVTASEMFDGLRAQFMQQTNEKGVKLNVDARLHVFFTDAILLERVLRNLLSNAVQYTITGSIIMCCEEHVY